MPPAFNALQKWLGHAQLTTTSFYADATGPEAQRNGVAIVYELPYAR
jgi:hypothetical protein